MNTNSVCDNCGQPIVWCRTETGKRVPVNPEPSPKGNLLLIAGQLPTVRPLAHSSAHQPGEPLFVSHDKTCCSHAKEHGERAATKKPLPPPGPVLFEEPHQ